MGESLSSLSYHKILESNRAELCNYDEVLDIIIASLKQNNIDAEVVLGGSVAKGTFLKDYDLDVFVRFKEKVDVDVWESIDAVREVGNIGAHMKKDINIIVEVEPEEAQLLIGLIEQLVDEWYVAQEDRKNRAQKLKDLAISKKTPLV